MCYQHLLLTFLVFARGERKREGRERDRNRGEIKRRREESTYNMGRVKESLGKATKSTRALVCVISISSCTSLIFATLFHAFETSSNFLAERKSMWEKRTATMPWDKCEGRKREVSWGFEEISTD
jgi:hypothetical protein